MSITQIQEDVLSLPGFLQALRRHRIKVLATFAVLASLTVLYAANRGRQYESAAKLFVRIGRETVSVDPTAEASGQVVSVTDTQEREIRSIVSLLYNRDLLEQVVDDLGADTILGDSDEPDSVTEKSRVAEGIQFVCESIKLKLVDCGILESVSDREQAIQFVRDSLTVAAGDSTSVIRISVCADSPKLAQTIVAKVIDLQLQYHLRANSSPGSLPFFSTQTEHLREELEAATQKMAAIKNDNSLASLDAKKDSLEAEMLSLNQKLTQARADLASTSSTISELEQQLSKEAEMVPSAETVGMANSAKAVMRQELYRLQILESEFLSKYKPTHPKVAEIRDQIEKAEVVFDREEQQVQTTSSTNAVFQQLRINLLVETARRAALEAEFKTLVSEKEQLKTEIEKVNGGEIQLTNIQRHVDLLDMNYRRYVENLEQVRINRELESQQISNLNVVQQPSFVDFPVGASNRVIIAAGLIAAAAFACLVGMLCALAEPKAVFLMRSDDLPRRSEPVDVGELREPLKV
jgi:uncharacterized protein involved in exopolysaccharide biosynthesis